ncbi:hypothetical protein [Spirosoma pulveris]
MRKILCWFASAGMLYFVAAPGLAQSSSNFLIDYTREGAWRYTSVRETPYQSNGRVIQHQLTALGKKLNHLSVVDAPAYSQLQSDLHGYLQRLENDSPDYGRAEVYHSVLLRLMQFEESIKENLIDNRHRDPRPIDADAAKQDEGQQAAVLPYALLFRRQDHRSKLVHIVTSGKVTILKHGPTYCLVRCGPHEGYLHKGMIVALP